MQLPDVLFFDGLFAGVDARHVETTARRKERTVSLARRVGFDPRVVGRDFDDARLRKLGIPYRTVQLAGRMPACDVSFSSRNAMSVLASRARDVPSVHFTDNDITARAPGLPAERLYNRLEAMATHTVVPAAFDTSVLVDRGASSERIHAYDGYKEDVYVASFDPDPTFVDRLPFGTEAYVVVRPEALTAAYVGDVDSVVPALLDTLVDAGENVVYLPRGRGDGAYADPYPDDRVFTPQEALHGLELVWNARCVLTGSGTMGREAASMGKPAVSFFPSQLLSVDRELVAEGRLLHSRDADEIGAYVAALDDDDVSPDRTRARRTRRDVVDVVTDILRRLDREA